MKQYPRAKPRGPSANDIADAKILEACEKAAVNALRPIIALNRDRFLRELQPHELRCMVVAVVSEYLTVRRLLEVAELNDDIPDLA